MGIRFYKEPDLEKEYFVKKNEIFKDAFDYLQKRLFQSNFHTYYKAIKKLGKGNFATVRIKKNI